MAGKHNPKRRRPRLKPDILVEPIESLSNNEVRVKICLRFRVNDNVIAGVALEKYEIYYFESGALKRKEKVFSSLTSVKDKFITFTEVVKTGNCTLYLYCQDKFGKNFALHHEFSADQPKPAQPEYLKINEQSTGTIWINEVDSWSFFSELICEIGKVKVPVTLQSTNPFCYKQDGRRQSKKVTKHEMVVDKSCKLKLKTTECWQKILVVCGEFKITIICIK